jgi:hypothetical protein
MDIDITEDEINLSNDGGNQGLMDILYFFANRIESISYNDRRETVIEILGIENRERIVEKGYGAPTQVKLVFGENPDDTGEMHVLQGAMQLFLQGLYKGNHIRTPIVPRISTSEPRIAEQRWVSDVRLFLALDPFDSFPLHERALRKLRKELKELAMVIGKDYPDSLDR